MTNTTVEPTKITAKQLFSLLRTYKEKGKLRVHSFTGGFALMGCAMDVSSIRERIKGAGEDIYLSGPRMKAMGHGVCYWDEKTNKNIFLETDENKFGTFNK